MARGWESKAIEAQQEEASRDRGSHGPWVPDPQAAARRSLELARANASGQLARAERPHHRAMLSAAIKELDERLRQLDGS